jgi:hypothetical protein
MNLAYRAPDSKLTSGPISVRALRFASVLALAVLTAGTAFAQINEATTQPPESQKPRFPQLPDDSIDVPKNEVPGSPETIVSPKEGEFVGRIEKVDGRSLSFKLNDPERVEAEVKTVTVSPNAKVTLNREPAKLADLKASDFVRILTPPGDAKVAIEVAAARVIHDTPPQPEPMPKAPRPRVNADDPLPNHQGGLGVVVSDSPQNGVLILQVNRDTPAWDAGIQTGDYLLELEAQEIVTPEDFLRTVRKHAPRETVRIVVWRKGKPLRGDVVLTTREAADDREAEDGRALIVAETHGDDTVVIKRTPDRTEVLDREPDQPTVVLDREPATGTAVVIDPARVAPLPTDYDELAKQYRLLLERVQQLEQQIDNRTKD